VKLYAPDRTVLLDITAIKKHRDGLVIEGKIMGAMPMKAILTPRELRNAFSLIKGPSFLAVISMLFRRSGK
jgi:hypothetical protein